ncbi:MAG: YceI family protein [Campylobacterota bacterium]|nr:YceI family protein [Campylobacterota bacterium]
MKRFYSIVISCLLIMSFVKADEMVIDSSHSEVGFSIKHMMISNVKGKFKEYDAEIEFDLKKKIFTELDATIVAKSIDTGITKRDNHLRSEDFFEVVKYPKITYKMTKYTPDGDEGVMEGILTIRDVTKKVKLDVSVNGIIKDNEGNTRAGFTLEGKINRKEFGLKWNKALELGGFAVGDKVKIVIELSTMAL